jgi:hypothetical protein
MKNRYKVVGNIVFGGRLHCSKLFMPAVGCWKTQKGGTFTRNEWIEVSGEW